MDHANKTRYTKQKTDKIYNPDYSILRPADETRMGMSTKKGPGEIKCVIVGDGAVGKTSMLLSYTTGGIMMDYIPTCFDCYTVDMRAKERNYSMTIIDTAGQETYDRLRTLSYYDTDVFVVCFSVADVDSFENIKSKWIQELHQYRPDTPFILVGTQADQRDSQADEKLSSATINYSQRASCSSGTRASITSTSSGRNSTDILKQCVNFRKAKSLARKCGAHAYLECSALEGSGVSEVFQSALLTAVSPKRKRTPSFIKSIKSVFRFRRNRHSKTELN